MANNVGRGDHSGSECMCCPNIAGGADTFLSTAYLCRMTVHFRSRHTKLHYRCSIKPAYARHMLVTAAMSGWEPKIIGPKWRKIWQANSQYDIYVGHTDAWGSRGNFMTTKVRPRMRKRVAAPIVLMSEGYHFGL